MFGRAGRWTRTPSAMPLQPKKLKAHFWITFNFWWSARLADGLEPHLPPLSSQKNKMLIFGLHSTSGDQPGWLMDWNPICHRSPAKKIKCSFLDDFQLLMIAWAGQWTRTPSATTLQPKKWNAHFWITFNFWWLAGLVHGLKPYPPPLCSQKSEMLIFGLRSISGDWPGWSMDSNPIRHPSPAKKIKCSFLDYIQRLMIGRLVDGLEPHLPPFSSQKNRILVLELYSTSVDWPGLSIDSNPIHHPSPAKKIKSSFLDYIQLLMIGRAGRWTGTPSATPLQPKK